ncbi:cilia- and flagella-associated protein 44-like isoform X2 [Acanthochromis polyacanthus]|uniref:cilia- and flagella-associated protein 44-like isoform X2 n=1 Tax=Acanthochromis polyacanthus TaxID=80966 RepID=UPI0022342076|nr:cilia- and flagella-associated protein 44-like isoform X2 [Acanthochromis polyacanthus]
MAEENAAVNEETTSHVNTEGCEEAVLKEDDDGNSKKQLPADMYYEYEELYSRPFVTRDSQIPENLLHFFQSFCYDSGRRSNLQVLDDKTLIFVAGNLLVLLDISTKEQRYLRSCSGGGIGSIAVHPSKEYFAAAEKGNQPNIIVYEYPSLRPYRVLRGGTERAYSFAEFKQDGSLLASVGNAPDYMLTLWDWRQESVMLSCKAVSQEVYRVCFSSYNPGLLTSSGSGHIKFWTTDSTFTGVKLQGCMGNFGLTAVTNIEGFMELPTGKVVSGTDWGNLLLWDRSDIKVEICKKNGQTCHAGTVQPFALEDGQLLTFGSDGVIRGWDYELISGADCDTDSGRFEMEPLNEMVIGHNICISSMVKSSLSDSFVWFAQDSNGKIWKLDLSFSNKGLDVSKTSYLMATIALDYSVKVFDFLEKRELKTFSFKKNATTLSWAPLSVSQSGCLLLIGFEDGVVRVFELYNPQRLHVLSEHSPKDDAGLRLKQAFKPHNAAVTAVAYERNGEILATGSVDCTVFFFTVEEKFNPIGFVHVPGAVQALEWSPQSHPNNRLLILCQNGHVVEVQRPDPKARDPPITFHLSELPRRSFRFTSIKSRIKREEEIIKHRVLKEEKKKEKEERLKESQQTDAEQEEEEEEELSPLYIPDSPSPLYCGLYSRPGQFWLSMGGFDSGYLYHCKFSAEQDENPEKSQDVPFDFLPVHNADDDPIHTITFSSDRQLMLCGMHSGSIRVYPLQPGDHNITSMQAYWTLSVHDNEYGHLRHIRCSHDDHFVLTAGDDGNIFSFSLLPPEELQKSLSRKKAKVPSPREGFENEPLPLDIENPTADSIESAKQNLQKDRLRREAERKLQEKQKKLAGLQKKYEQVLKVNQSLPEHVHLIPEELQLDSHFYEHVERMKAERVMEVRKQLAWEQERYSIAFNKLQDWFKASPEANMVTVVAIRTDHRVSTYHLPVLTNPSAQQITPSSSDGDREDAAPEHSKHKTKPATDSSEVEEEKKLQLRDDCKRVKLGDRQEERLQRAAKKAEQARAKIEKRKQEWAQLYAEKPDKNYEDPRDVQAIREAEENLKLKSDVTVVISLKVMAKRKREELAALQENFREKQIEMNKRIVALRDSKVRLVSWLHTQAWQLQKVQLRLANHLHHSPPFLPSVLPEETPEKWLQYKLAALERYRVLREQRCKDRENVCWSRSEVSSLLEQVKKMEREEEKDEKERASSPSTSSVTTEEEETAVGEVAEQSELEVELQREEEIRLLYEQESLLKKMESSVSQFDTELLLLRQQKVRLDFQLKRADLHQLMLFQEMLILKQFEKREGILPEKLNRCIKEENSITSALEECKEQLELKQSQIVKLQAKEKTLHAAFQDLLIKKNYQHQEFLTGDFKRNIKPVKEEKKKGPTCVFDEEDSNEDDDWDNDSISTEDGGAAMDISVCPPGCNPEVFDYTMNLCERRQNLEESLAEERENVQTLRIQCDTLVKKETSAKSSRKAVEKELEQISREIQEEMNTLDVVVPLRLTQIQFTTHDLVQSDLSEALVLDSMQMNKLQEHIKQLEVDKKQQNDLCRQAKQQCARLNCSLKNMAVEITELEEKCKELMMTKFGRLIDLDALQMQTGNRQLEELKQEKLLQELEYDKELSEWDAKVDKAHDGLSEVTKRNTELLHSITSLNEEKIRLEHKLATRQAELCRPQHYNHSRRETQEDIQRLEETVKRQSQQQRALRREIDLLSRKGGHISPPTRAQLLCHTVKQAEEHSSNPPKMCALEASLQVPGVPGWSCACPPPVCHQHASHIPAWTECGKRKEPLPR